MKINSFNLIRTIKVITFILISIIGLTILILTYKSRVNFYSVDSSRDLIIAKNTTEFNNQSKYPPWSGGTYNYFPNSNFYYPLLSFFYKISDHKEPVMSLIFSTSFFISSLIFFYIGIHYFNYSVGIISYALSTTSILLFNSARLITQPYFIPFLSSLIILSLFKAKEHKSVPYSSITVILISLSIHLHYAIIAILPVVIISLLIIIFSFNKNKSKYVPLLISFIGILIFTKSLSFIPLNLSSYQSIVTNTAPQNLQQLVSQASNNTRRTFFSLVTNYNNYLLAICVITIIISTFLYFAIPKKNYHTNERIIIILLAQYLFTFYYSTSFRNHYDVAFYYLILFWIAINIEKVANLIIRNSSYKIGLISLVFIAIAFQRQIQIQKDFPPLSGINHVKNIQRIINTDINQYKITNYYVLYYLIDHNFIAPYWPYYFFEEENQKKQLIDVNDLYNDNLSKEMITKNNVVYLYCDYSNATIQPNQDYCQKYLNSYSKSNRKFSELESSDINSKIYKIE